MLVAILLLIAFKIIVILKINIHNTSVKEKKQANLSSNIFASPACVSPNSSFLESHLWCWSPRYTFVLNISALFCSLLYLFFAESVKVLGRPTFRFFGLDAMIFLCFLRMRTMSEGGASNILVLGQPIIILLTVKPDFLGYKSCNSLKPYTFRNRLKFARVTQKIIFFFQFTHF